MDLAVNAIIKEEKLEATGEEVEKQYNDLAEKYLSLIHILPCAGERVPTAPKKSGQERL